MANHKDNELAKILAKSDSSEDVQTAWEASKKIGPLIAGKIRELARIRNQAAQKQGFRDFFEKSPPLMKLTSITS